MTINEVEQGKRELERERSSPFSLLLSVCDLPGQWRLVRTVPTGARCPPPLAIERQRPRELKRSDFE